MATYEGSQGIAALKAKIKTKSKMLVGESLEKIAILLIDESPLGAPYYAPPFVLVITPLQLFQTKTYSRFHACNLALSMHQLSSF